MDFGASTYILRSLAFGVGHLVDASNTRSGQALEILQLTGGTTFIQTDVCYLSDTEVAVDLLVLDEVTDCLYVA